VTVTEPAPTVAAEIGQSRRRKEDARLITGRTNWTDNITLPGLLHLAILRSPLAHARITSIDTSAVLGRPNVIAVFTGRDLAAEQGSLPCAWPVTPDMVHPDHPALAVDEVHFSGEAVAVVVARDKSSAVDALEAIDVEYEQLPVVLDMEEALAEGSPLVHADKGTNRSFDWIFDSGEAGTGGSVAEALAGSEVVVKRRYVQQRLIPAFMEPRAVVCDPTGDQYRLWSSTQVPHILRLMLALTTGTPEHKVRVIAPDVGGGFGGKLQVTPEEIITFLVGKRLGKPVKYNETRSESILAAHHGRDQIQYLQIGARRDGTITGLDVKLLADMGAYLGLVTPGVPILGAFMFPAIYKFPAYRFECTGVFTTKAWTDAYRGAGRPEATFAIERPSWAWTPWNCARRTGSSTRSSRSPRWRDSSTTRGTTSRRRRRRWSSSGTTSSAGNRPSAGSARTRSSWASASRRSRRCAASPRPGCSDPCPTAPAGGKAHRSGCSRRARSRS
jgi:carbon-monoxide dehydrogenase large subunit